MLFITGNQVPVTPLIEVVGKASMVSPEQTASTCVKVGLVFTVTFVAVLGLSVLFSKI